MNGIIAYGSYVPYNRLDRTAIAGSLGSGGGRGQRAVASYDEDTTSMGVEAARNAIGSTDVAPAGLTFSTSLPGYLDKTNATTIHAALAMPRDTWAVDALGSTRSSTGSLLNACSHDFASLAVMSDIRTGLPGSAEESAGGDAAAAFVCGSDAAGPVIAELVAVGTATGEFLDRWRVPGDTRSKVWEERFGEQAYLDLVGQAVPAALEMAGVAASDLDKVVLTGLQARAVRSSVRAVGLSPDTIVDDLASSVGNSGAAHPGLLLASALDGAEPGQLIAVIILADGCDAIIFRTTDAIADYTPAERTVPLGALHLRRLFFGTPLLDVRPGTEGPLLVLYSRVPNHASAFVSSLVHTHRSYLGCTTHWRQRAAHSMTSSRSKRHNPLKRYAPAIRPSRAHR